MITYNKKYNIFILEVFFLFKINKKTINTNIKN